MTLDPSTEHCSRCQAVLPGGARFCHACGAPVARPDEPIPDLERFFFYAVDLLCIAGVDGYFRRVNPAFTRTLGWSAEELLSRPFSEFIHPDDLGDTSAEVGKLASGAPTLSFENRYRCKDGTWRDLQWTCYPESGTGLLYAVARDVTELRRREQRLDHLTGAASPRTLSEILPLEWRRAVRSGQQLAAAVIDLDHLRDYNLRFGHAAGDECLRKVAEIIQARVRRAGDLVARVDGAAFVVLLQGGLTVDQAAGLCEEIRAAVAGLGLPHPGNDEGVLTVSVGVVSARPDRNDDSRTLLDRARAALALAKREGRNRVTPASAEGAGT